MLSLLACISINLLTLFDLDIYRLCIIFFSLQGLRGTDFTLLFSEILSLTLSSSGFKFSILFSLTGLCSTRFPCRNKTTSVFTGFGIFIVWFSLAGLLNLSSSRTTISVLDSCLWSDTLSWVFNCGWVVLKLSIAWASLKLTIFLCA
jgi:hypothetical protein